ncbi:MAG: HAMP domain-containing histidine kinase [Sphingobacteriales bacterium]|nr:HAMP domain-containing histidine kinase [Sphingobacteriales bacterium]
MLFKNIRSNRLFWKISAAFFALLIILGFAYIIIASHVSKKYYNQVNQQLYGNIASHLAHFTQPLKDGKPDTLITHDIIHSIMVINPSVEVYLLDTTGKIIDFVVPDKTVKTHQVSLDKVKTFIGENGRNYIAGDNPKEPGVQSIFSAAPVLEMGKTTGYVYAVLASEKQREILSASAGNLYYNLGSRIFLITLFIAFVLGALIFFLITDSVSRIARVVKRFKEGDYSARIEGRSKGNLGLLTSTFNEMADVIVDNINKITQTDKLRQELIANVSHDLRTPLAIMQGYAETLVIKQDNIAKAEQHKYQQIILDSTKKLSLLVDQLFQYSKLEANQVEPEKEQFLLSELVSDILIKYNLLAQEKKIRLQLNASEDLPPVFADIALTERVLQNLIDNAFKFTFHGGSITVHLENRPAGVEVRIADTGIGIAKHEQVFIFERYKQLSDEASLKRGMGLGLAIVKKILDLHQVSINVKSAPGEGTVFWFELPFFSRINIA